MSQSPVRERLADEDTHTEGNDAGSNGANGDFDQDEDDVQTSRRRKAAAPMDDEEEEAVDDLFGEEEDGELEATEDTA
jgi:hypothetical protein